MKRFLFFLILSLFVNSKTVFADVCFYINREAAQKAVLSLPENSEIINYCELCNQSEALSETIKETSIKKSPENNYYILSINNSEKDIAYVYVKKNNNTYENLAYIAGCTDAQKNKISHFKSAFPVIKEKSPTQISADIKKEIDKTIQNCFKEDTENECLYTAIKEQIITGFEIEEQKIMLKTLDEARKSVFRFYDNIYNKNKYCLGKCGSLANHMAESDETEFLKNMLSRLLYLNEVKNGY